MEHLTTEKQALGFFGAICGVMVSQIPELKPAGFFDYWAALRMIICVTGFVIALTHVRRSYGQRFGLLTGFGVATAFITATGIVFPQFSQASQGGFNTASNELISVLNLKYLILSFIFIWTAVTFIDVELNKK